MRQTSYKTYPGAPWLSNTNTWKYILSVSTTLHHAIFSPRPSDTPLSSSPARRPAHECVEKYFSNLQAIRSPALLITAQQTLQISAWMKHVSLPVHKITDSPSQPQPICCRPLIQLGKPRMGRKKPIMTQTNHLSRNIVAIYIKHNPHRKRSIIPSHRGFQAFGPASGARKSRDNQVTPSLVYVAACSTKR